MHPNPAFRSEPDILHLTLARTRGFGMLAVNADPAPLLSHVPFVLNETGDQAELHLVRSNPITRLDMPLPAVIAVEGPDAYISPDWYGDPAQVPTWNYVAVHLRGVLEPGPENGLRAHLDRLSAQFEERLTPKPPWTTDKMPAEKLAGMMRAIRLFRFRVDAVDGTWKLNQNKDEAMRRSAASSVRNSPIGHETAQLSELMMGGHHMGFEF